MSTKSRIKLAALVALSLALLIAAACAVEKKGIDGASGGDHKRDLAKKLPVGRAVTDSVSAPKGDHTDWKYIKIKGDGDLTVNVTVDNPSVVGSVLVYNQLGEPLGRKIINAKEHSYEFELPVEDGEKYFVKMQATNFESVYTVANQFEPKEVEVAAAPPTPEEPKRHRRRRRRRVAPKPAPEPEPEEDPTKIVVTTTILNVVPWKEGKASRITFKRGGNDGIKRGATVAISSGGSCIVKEVFPRASVCMVPKPPETFKAGTRVVITSDR